MWTFKQSGTSRTWRAQTEMVCTLPPWCRPHRHNLKALVLRDGHPHQMLRSPWERTLIAQMGSRCMLEKCLEWQESIGKNWDKHLDLGVLWGTYVERNPVSRIQEFHLNQTHLASDGRRPLWRHLQPCVGVKQNIGRLTWQWTKKSGTIASSGKLVSREFGTSNRCSCSILSWHQPTAAKLGTSTNRSCMVPVVAIWSKHQKRFKMAGLNYNIPPSKQNHPLTSCLRPFHYLRTTHAFKESRRWTAAWPKAALVCKSPGMHRVFSGMDCTYSIDWRWLKITPCTKDGCLKCSKIFQAGVAFVAFYHPFRHATGCPSAPEVCGHRRKELAAPTCRMGGQ